MTTFRWTLHCIFGGVVTFENYPEKVAEFVIIFVGRGGDFTLGILRYSVTWPGLHPQINSTVFN